MTTAFARVTEVRHSLADLGNVIAPGGSSTLGTILGAVGGFASRAIDRDGGTCH